MHKRQEKVAIAVSLFVILFFAPLIFTFNVHNPFFVAKNSLRNVTAVANVKESVKHTVSSTPLSAFKVVDIYKGDGDIVQKGDTVYVHYVGILDNGKEFDTSTNSTTPFIATIGDDDLIQGWDIGLRGMRVGGTRRLVIPPELAYGNVPIADTHGKVVIPANTTLTFDIVLLKVDKAK